MYPDTGPGPFSPYFQDFSHEVQQLFLQELFHPHQSPPLMIESSFNSEYDLGGGGDLFKALEPIYEEPISASCLDPVLDPMAAAVSMVPFTDQDLNVGDFESLQNDAFADQDLNVGDFESLQNGELFDKASYECKNDILVNSSAETCLIDELVDTGIPVLASDIQPEGSLSCSVIPIGTNLMTPSFLEYSELDFEAALGMRRAFSDGDIKWPGVWPGVNSCSRSSEDRQQKLSRYRIKKSKRNFGRKIKYACRKALADSQPRIRGRFAKI